MLPGYEPSDLSTDLIWTTFLKHRKFVSRSEFNFIFYLSANLAKSVKEHDLGFSDGSKSMIIA